MAHIGCWGRCPLQHSVHFTTSFGFGASNTDAPSCLSPENSLHMHSASQPTPKPAHAPPNPNTQTVNPSAPLRTGFRSATRACRGASILLAALRGCMSYCHVDSSLIRGPLMVDIGVPVVISIGPVGTRRVCALEFRAYRKV